MNTLRNNKKREGSLNT